MSYSGCLVFLPPGTTLESVADWLRLRLDRCQAEISGDAILFELDDARIRILLDRHPCVAEEAAELSERAAGPAAAALRESDQRLEIVPADPSIDPDTIYNALLVAFETLWAMPGSVGLDPFDGEIYCAR
ncbi:MAG: hypothetical protein JXR96_00110 [Deltaproteobacteria bacterium]|nr:hypothetical protein [Deltaproteobacteria bacterium]